MTPTTLCVVFFIVGFLTDKIRIFPFFLGFLLGVLLLLAFGSSEYATYVTY